MHSLIVEPHSNWTKLVLNRPAVKNALNTAVLAELTAALRVLDAEPACRAVLICGAEGNFAAGADIGELAGKTTALAATDPRKTHWAAIRGFSKPLVAAVDGVALGGGLELALMADCMVLGETARLGLPETNPGLIPGAGGAQRLLALVGRARASRLVLLGEIIDARTAHDWGLAAWISEGSALPLAEALTAKIALRAPLAMQAAKAMLVAGDESHLAMTAERAAFAALHDTSDAAEGIAALLGKRKPVFTGQ